MLCESRLCESRLHVGRDVPWVSSWSDEAMLGVRPCPTAQGRLAMHQAQRPGLGAPEFPKHHLNRQRASVWHMLCPMCGRPTDETDRWTHAATATTAGDLRAQGLAHLLPEPALAPDRQRVLNAGAIAPMHRDCAEVALAHCPQLHVADAELRRFPERWTVAPVMITVGPPPPALGPEAQVVSFLLLCGLEG